jgi:hypothetical protein
MTGTGTIYGIVRWLEEHKSAFVVSRLIMLSGIPVRKYTLHSEDEEEALRKVTEALPAVLSAREIEELRRFCRW